MHDGVSNHQPGEFPAQMASNAEMFPFDDVFMVKLTFPV